MVLYWSVGFCFFSEAGDIPLLIFLPPGSATEQVWTRTGVSAKSIENDVLFSGHPAAITDWEGT